MTPAPTGRRETRDGTDQLVLTREFRAPIADVWAAVTEPDRLARWIGTWTGDPATGAVAFRMTAEGDDVAEETYTIGTCAAPRRLVLDTPNGWHLDLDLELAEAAGTTTLTFAQPLTDPAAAADIGPGWEYYLDRLVAAETGADVAAVDWDSYYPAQCDHYRALFG
jgi:uncharacterized protein YndB with AHSA1/START domain